MAYPENQLEVLKKSLYMHKLVCINMDVSAGLKSMTLNLALYYQKTAAGLISLASHFLLTFYVDQHIIPERNF